MAYLLSTPTKRGAVVRTQALVLILAIIAMFAVESVVGLTAVQLAHKGIWQDKYTPDVVAAADVLNVDKDTLSDDLTLILQNENALKAGAEARKIDVDVYAAYITLKTADSSAQPPNASELQQKVTLGVTAAAEVLDIEPADLLGDMSKIKGSKEAMSAAAEASGLPEELFTTFINAQLANKEISADKGIDFSVKKFLTLNLGLLLLQLTFSSISFLFSCVFNLSKNSFALGAGIPIASFIFQILQQTSSDLRMFKYLTFNTLYDSTKMLSGEGFAVQFAALAVVAVVLYCVGMRVFTKKDLPL
jgi:ABC-2 type transport system permease protein